VKNTFLLLSLLVSITVLGSKNEFAISLIPDSLLKNANSVVRLSETRMIITDPGTANYLLHKVVTVLNEAGAKELDIFLYYNHFMVINSFKASLYNSEGRLVNRRTDSDLNDFALHDGFSLFNDARCKKMQTGGGTYPVTIDYTYEYRYNGILSYPDWEIQSANQSVELATLTIEMPSATSLNYKCENIALPPVTMERKGNASIYSWNALGLKARSLPVNSYSSDYFLPQVHLIPASFEIAGHKGSWASWKTFGQAMNDMWKDTRNLSPEIIAEAKNLVRNAKSDREKAELLYTYLQNNFRYVSIQIGIGGYVPFDATTVHATKYGDCKALSNYLCALLNAVGIRSYPALINAGRNRHSIDTSFPANNFNHAILYTELQDGPLWLECTSNSLPFGELGVFTENRYALLLTEDGGKIMSTPVSHSGMNALNLSSEILLDSSMHASVNSRVEVSGEFRQQAKEYLMQGNTKEQSYYAFNYLGIRQWEDYNMEDIKDTATVISFNLPGSTQKIYEFKASGKTFLPATLMKHWYENISFDTTERCDLLINYPFVRNEKITYHLPAGVAKSLPPNLVLNNAVIQFERKCEQTNGEIVSIVTSLRVTKNIIEAQEVALLKESFGVVNKCLQQKLILNTN
jgi:hypothetical protein